MANWTGCDTAEWTAPEHGPAAAACAAAAAAAASSSHINSRVTELKTHAAASWADNPASCLALRNPPSRCSVNKQARPIRVCQLNCEGSPALEGTLVWTEAPPHTLGCSDTLTRTSFYPAGKEKWEQTNLSYFSELETQYHIVPTAKREKKSAVSKMSTGSVANSEQRRRQRCSASCVKRQRHLCSDRPVISCDAS